MRTFVLFTLLSLATISFLFLSLSVRRHSLTMQPLCGRNTKRPIGCLAPPALRSSSIQPKLHDLLVWVLEVSRNSTVWENPFDEDAPFAVTICIDLANKFRAYLHRASGNIAVSVLLAAKIVEYILVLEALAALVHSSRPTSLDGGGEASHSCI